MTLGVDVANGILKFPWMVIVDSGQERNLWMHSCLVLNAQYEKKK